MQHYLTCLFHLGNSLGLSLFFFKRRLQYTQTRALGSGDQLSGPLGVHIKEIRVGAGLLAPWPHTFCKHCSGKLSFGWFVWLAVRQEPVKWDLWCYLEHCCGLGGGELGEGWQQQPGDVERLGTARKGFEGNFPRIAGEGVCAEEIFC